MYRPLWLNLTSEIEDMISEKKERLLGSSGSSNTGQEKESKHKLDEISPTAVQTLYSKVFLLNLEEDILKKGAEKKI